MEYYIDMDEVVVNLSKEVIKNYNLDFKDDIDYKSNTKYWWGDCIRAPKSYFENMLIDPSYSVFKKSSPIEGMVELVDRLISRGVSVVFLTAPQYEGGCYEDKVSWLYSNFKWFNPDIHLIATSRKDLLSASNRVLIDDNPTNLNKWAEVKDGGVGISFGNYLWTQEYAGIQADNATDLWKTISICEGWS